MQPVLYLCTIEGNSSEHCLWDTGSFQLISHQLVDIRGDFCSRGVGPGLSRTTRLARPRNGWVIEKLLVKSLRCWCRRRLTASCWLIRWAMANCCLTSCGLSWGERSPPGAKRGCRAAGGGTWARSGGLWWSCPWDDGACGCPWDGGWDWAEFWGSPEPPFTRDPPLFNGPSCARPARWGGGRWANTQKSVRLSLSTAEGWRCVWGTRTNSLMF